MNVFGIDSNRVLGVSGPSATKMAGVEEADFWTSRGKEQQDNATFSTQAAIFSANTASLVDKTTNTISIKPNEVFSLGKVNGHQLNFRLFNDGGFETNFSARIQAAPAGSAVSAYDMHAAEAFTSFSRDEHMQANKITSRLNDLLRVADGRMSVEQFNAPKDSLLAYEASDLMAQLGVDINKPFSVNGVRFALENGQLKKH